MNDESHLSVDQVDRLAQERPPYPVPSDNSRERCSGKTGWHRPQSEDWNAGAHSSTCTWCDAEIQRRFSDGVWRTSPGEETQLVLSCRRCTWSYPPLAVYCNDRVVMENYERHFATYHTVEPKRERLTSTERLAQR